MNKDPEEIPYEETRAFDLWEIATDKRFTDSEKLWNVETMFGTNSKEHRDAKERFEN